MATVEELQKAQTTANTGATTTAPTTTATEGENRINAMFDAQKEAQLKQLETAHNQSMTAAQEAKDKIAPQYQISANDLATQYERNRRNFNQQAAGNGLNTGTFSQAALAQNSAFQRDMGKLRTSESEALTAADKNISNLTTTYQNNIAAAVADNDYKRAAALLDEYNTQYNRNMAKAEQLASYGDFSMYAELYGKDVANKMKKSWAAQNPELAYMTGVINENQYNNLINGLPINYSGGAGSSGGGGISDGRSYTSAASAWDNLSDDAKSKYSGPAEYMYLYLS